MDIKTSYSASLTREPFMFYEMKITASLLEQGCETQEIIQKIVSENLYQYPTEKSLKSRARVCIRRLSYLDDELISWINNKSTVLAKQVCLYALMKDSRLIYEFMITVIGEKYATKNFSYSRDIIKKFLKHLQEQDSQVNTWSESTVGKISSVISGMLKEVGFIDNCDSKYLNDFVIDYRLKEKIITNKEDILLSAFNNFEV